MANTVVEDLTLKIREEIAPGIRESLPAVDGVFSKIKTSSMGVTSEGIGRDWFVKHNFTASVAGAFHWTASPLGDTTLSGPVPARILDESALVSFPGAEEAANMGIFQRRLQLNEGLGNFFLPIEMFQTDALKASTFQYVALNIQQVAKTVAQIKATTFYAVAPAGTMQPLGQIEAVDAAGGTGEATVTISIIETTNVYNVGRIRNFLTGMYVDVLDYSNAWASLVPANNYGVVTAVDYIDGTVTIVLSDGGFFTAQVAARDVIIPRACGATTVGYGPSGLETWIQSSGTVFNVALATYPQLKSLVAAVSGSLTESLLNKYVGAFQEAYGIKLDSFLTTGGVVREMIDQVEDLGVFQRQGAAVNAQFGWTDIGYQYNGEKYDWLMSSYVSPGRLYGVQLKNGNLVRYVPPKVPGSGSRGEFDGDVDFIVPWATGGNDIFKPLHNSSGHTTKVKEAPFRLMEEIAPRDIQSIKLTSLTESNL